MNYFWRTKPGGRSHAFYAALTTAGCLIYEASIAECGRWQRLRDPKWPIARDELNRCAHCARAVEKRTKRRAA